MTQGNGNGWKTWALSILGAALFLVLGLYGKSIQGQVDSSNVAHEVDLKRVETRMTERVDTNVHDISETKGDIKAINIKITTIEDDVGELKADVKEISKGVILMQAMQSQIIQMLKTQINGDSAGGFRP